MNLHQLNVFYEVASARSFTGHSTARAYGGALPS